MNAETTDSFGLSDYWRMMQARGIRLPLGYFTNVHWFDLLHGTDTHRRSMMQPSTRGIGSAEHGHYYSASWTSAIRTAYSRLHVMGLLADPYAFIDIGCGKGKTCLMWRLTQVGRGDTVTEAIGLDYDLDLIEIARANFLKVFGTEGAFFAGDATQFNYSSNGMRLVVYMYNPFNGSILDQCLPKLPNGSIIIYNNPVHDDVVTRHGFQMIHRLDGWNRNLTTRIYIDAR